MKRGGHTIQSESACAANGKVSEKKDSTGAWTQFGFDANGRTISVTDPNRNEVVTTSYTPVDPADPVLLNDTRPRTIVRTINAIEVERTYYVYTTNRQEIVERCATQGAAYGSPANLRTVTTWYPATDDNYSAGRVQSVRYEDGQMDVYTYSWINSIWTETVTRVHEQELDPVAMQTTRRLKIYSRVGNLIETRTELMTDVDVWEQIDGVTYEYTVAGKESKRTTFNGLITTSEWAGTCCGKSSETAPDGTRTTFTYDDNNRLIVRTVLDPNPIEMHVAYDAIGRQIATFTTNRVAQLGTAVQRTTYDALSRVTSRTDQLGNTTTTAYSADERTRTITNPNGATEITVTDASGRPISLSGTAVAPRTYTYGVNADLSAGQAGGTQWTKVYQGAEAIALAWSKTTQNMLGHTIREEMPGYDNILLSTEYAYDLVGRLVSETGSFKPVVTYAYNTFGEKTTTTQAVSNEWRKSKQNATYERTGGQLWQVATTTQSCSDVFIAPLVTASRRQLTGLTAANPMHLESIDARGNASVSWMEFDSGTKRQFSFRRVPYATNLEVSHARFGQNIEVVSLAGVTNTPGYDGLGRVVSAMDGRGNTTTFSYNSKGERVCIIDAATNATWYAFDNFGRLASVTNGLGEVTVYEYNLQGRKIYEGGGTYPVRYVYDEQGRMTSMTTYRDESGQGDTTTWTYDDASSILLSKTYADNKGPSYTYTPDGKLASRTWARGVTTTYAYDGWSNLTNILHSDGTPSVSMAYNTLGYQIIAEDAVGVTTFAYDSFSSLTNETVSGQYAKSLNRHLDDYGRNVGYSMDGQRKQTVAYDPATERVVGMDGFAWQYLPGTDLKQSLSYPNGTVAEWVYEPQRDLLMLVSNDVFSAYAHENDAVGRRISKNTEHYGYNNRGELIAATNTAPVASYAYLFDDIGNRIVADELGMNIAYTVNALNQYTNIVAEAAFVPEFDDDGNQTLVKTSTGIWNVTYNAENRPVVWSNEAVIITMDFDRMGRRVWYKSISGAQTNAFSKFVYDGYLCVQQLDGLTGVVTQEFVWDPTESVATRPLKWSLLASNRAFYYFYDGNKNVSDVIDTEDDTLAAHYNYGPFGAVTSATGPFAAVNPYRFSSEWHDDELGCVYYNYRHYNPLDGRWTSRDPFHETLEFEQWNQLGADRLNTLVPLFAFHEFDISLLIFLRNSPMAQYDRYGLGWMPGKCCNRSSKPEWGLSDEKWELLPPGKCIGYIQDCDGMTCGGGFYSIYLSEWGECKTPGCDSWPFNRRRWTPTSQDKNAESPGDRGAGRSLPPGYEFGPRDPCACKGE